MKTLLFTLTLVLGLGYYFVKTVNSAKLGVNEYACISYKLNANCLTSK
jgi:hypothetical protein